MRSLAHQGTSLIIPDDNTNLHWSMKTVLIAIIKTDGWEKILSLRFSNCKINFSSLGHKSAQECSKVNNSDLKIHETWSLTVPRLDKTQTSLVLLLTLISFNSPDSDPIPLAYIQLNLSKCAPWYVWKPRGLRRGN